MDTLNGIRLQIMPDINRTVGYLDGLNGDVRDTDPPQIINILFIQVIRQLHSLPLVLDTAVMRVYHTGFYLIKSVFHPLYYKVKFPLLFIKKLFIIFDLNLIFIDGKVRVLRMPIVMAEDRIAAFQQMPGIVKFSSFSTKFADNTLPAFSGVRASQAMGIS